MGTRKRESLDENKLLGAARRCDEDLIDKLTKSGKVDLNASDTNGSTAVHFCCKAANLSSLATLLERGARTNVFDHSGMAPIHHAASKDYVETMAVLVSYKGSVNIKNKIDGKTALHYAGDSNRRRALKFLLFCGADPQLQDNAGKYPDLSVLSVKNTGDLQDAFKEKKITIFGKMIHRMERHVFLEHNFTIDNTSKDSKVFSFFCRTMSVEHTHLDTISPSQLSKYLEIPDMEIASDVYEYLVNQRVNDVTVTVPIYAMPNEFDDIYVKDSNDNEYKCQEIKQTKEGIFLVVRMTFVVDENNFMAIAVFKRIRTDVHVVTGESQTMTSSQEDGFVIYLPEKCLPKDSEVKLKVLPTEDFHNTLNTEHVTNISNFYNIHIEHKVRKPIVLRLPCPAKTASVDGTSEFVVYHARAMEEENNWRAVDSEMTEEGRTVTVMDKTVNTGTCIVAEIQNNPQKGTLVWMKDFLKWLYSHVFTRTRSCCFLAMTKHVSKTNFKVLMILSDEKRIDDLERSWTEQKYITQKSQRTAGYLCRPGKAFDITVDKTVSVQGRSVLALLYRSGKDEHQEFLVTGQEHDVVVVYVSKRQKDTINLEVENPERTLLTQINVDLLKATPVDLQPSVLNKFTEYPDDTFLYWLAGEIGHEWTMIGIGLGLKYSFLESIEKGNDARRTNLTMLYSWRMDSDKSEDLGITVMLHSLTNTGRKDLVTQINKQVEKLMERSPKERLCVWVRRRQSDGTTPTKVLHDVDGAASNKTHGGKDFCVYSLVADPGAVSPFDERFLLTIVNSIHYNPHVLQQLNLPQSKMENIKRSVVDETAAMLKCILIAKRSYRDEVSFLDDLLNALKHDENNLAIVEIKTECQKWLRSLAGSIHGNTKRLQALLKNY